MVSWTDGAGIEGGSFEMRTRAKSSPACMRWYVERQVGRHLRRISDDFNTHIPRLTTVSDDLRLTACRKFCSTVVDLWNELDDSTVSVGCFTAFKRMPGKLEY